MLDKIEGLITDEEIFSRFYHWLEKNYIVISTSRSNVGNIFLSISRTTGELLYIKHAFRGVGCEYNGLDKTSQIKNECLFSKVIMGDDLYIDNYEDENQAAIVLKDVGERIVISNAMTVKEKFTLAISVCKSISVLHNEKIVHRDLKISNFVQDKFGKVRIIDFGLSSFKGDVNKSKVYTEGYSKISEIDDVAYFEYDIYSLSGILFHIFTGYDCSFVHRSVNLGNILNIINVPPEVIDVFSKCRGEVDNRPSIYTVLETL